MYQKFYHWEDKPFQLNTVSKWREYGYAVRKNAPVRAELKTERRRQRYPLYHVEDITPLKGKEAMHRRYMTMLTHFRSQMERLIVDFVDYHETTVSAEALGDIVSKIIDEGGVHINSGYLARPALSYFNRQYFTDPDWAADIDQAHQVRLRNVTLELMYAAIEAGAYHQRATERQHERQTKQAKEEYRQQLTRAVVACVPVHALSEWKIELMGGFGNLLLSDQVQIDYLVGWKFGEHMGTDELEKLF